MNRPRDHCLNAICVGVFQFEQAIGSLPDAKLPVANQLEQAISTIKTNVKVILDTQAENKALKTVMLTCVHDRKIMISGKHIAV